MSTTDIESAAASQQAKKLIEKARAFIVLDHPFFASIMLKKPFVESDKVPTLGVTDTGTVYYNPEFIATKEVNQVVWAICHEILHYASGHGIRRQRRDKKKWNIAGDMWINDTLNRAAVGKPIPGCVDVPGSAARTCEDIYASFPPDDDNGSGGGSTGQLPSGGKPDPNGNDDQDPLANDMEDDPNATESDKHAADAERKLEVAEAAQVAKMKGKLPGVLQKFAADTIDSKVPWHDILERFFADCVAADYSWARPNRRYAPDFYLPSTGVEPAMGEVVLQVDISGSVSRQEIKHYNGHIKRIVEQCRPSKVHVIYTDTQVQLHQVYDKPEDVEIQYHSGGGTRMEAGFDYLKDQGIEPEVVVTLTDGYDAYTSPPEFATVWCVSSDQTPPYGHVIHFTLE